ncbi:MAG: DUF4157 domain-containing protein [Betaproteobacteria bacterium]|nr:DUF4157 domain-containing protein [Betaproteobacteria bacterium]
MKTHAQAKAAQPPSRAQTAPVGDALAHKTQHRDALINAGVQPRLQIGAVNSPLEREADAIAKRVTHMPAPIAGQASSEPRSQPPQATLIQTKVSTPTTATQASPQVESGLSSLNSGGAPLDTTTRAFFEPRFGQDFSQVRIHTGSNAARMNESLNAKAFTLGNDIAFAPNQYSANTSTGRDLLGHELAHVVQQRNMNGGVAQAKLIQCKAKNKKPDPTDEVIVFDEAAGITSQSDPEDLEHYFKHSLGVSSTQDLPEDFQRLIQIGRKKKEIVANNYAKLTNSPGLQRLKSENERALLLLALVSALNINPESSSLANNLASLIETVNPDYLPGIRTRLDTLFKDKDFQSFSTMQKTQVLEIFSFDIDAIYSIIFHQFQLNGKSILLDTDKDGNTLLHNLHLLATRPLGAGKKSLSTKFRKAGLTSKKLLSHIAVEAATPNNLTITQGSKGTCTAASMQYALARLHPAEYARIMQGLLSKGEVELRRGDEILKISPGSIEEDDNFMRSPSQRIFQAAMMDFSNKDHVYNNKTDKSTFPGERAYSGLDNMQIEYGLKALFGKYKRLGAATNLSSLDLRNSPPPIYASLKWGSGYHSVVIEKIENERVYFWNPQGRKIGSELQNPPRRVENSSESMAVSEFQQRAEVYYVFEWPKVDMPESDAAKRAKEALKIK